MEWNLPGFGKKEAQVNKKKILICGAYGLGNSGDESILRATVDRLREYDKNTEITVITRTPAATSKRFGVKTIGSFNFRGILISMKLSDILIFGGGSLIQDVTSTRSLLYYLWIIENAYKKGCKVLVYGCGIGPVRSLKNRLRTAKVFNNCVAEITVRDADSFNTLKEYGVTIPPIHQASDLALSLQKCNEITIDNTFRHFGIDPYGCYACFCLRDWYGIDDKIDEIRVAAGRCYYEHGLVPLFLALNPKKDMIITTRITEGLNVPYAVIDQELSTSLLIGVISRMKVMISLRLHALVFAAGQGVPFVAINYDPKVASFSSYINNKNCLDIDDLSSSSIMNAISDATNLSSKLSLQENSKRIIANESENEKMLSKYLEMSPISYDDRLLRLALFVYDLKNSDIRKSLAGLIKNIDYYRIKLDVYFFCDIKSFEKPVNNNLNFIQLNPSSTLSCLIPFKIYSKLKSPYVSAKPYDIAIDFDAYHHECALGAINTPAEKHVMWVHDDVAMKRRQDWKYDFHWLFFSGKFRSFDEFVCVSPRIINGFKYATHLPDADITAIPSFVDGREIIVNSKEDVNCCIDVSMYNICSSGTLCRQKGFDILLDKFAKAYSQRNDLRLFIIGSGPDERKLKEQCVKLGIDEVVTFTGELSNPFAVEKYMDGFALCSRYEGEAPELKEAEALGLELFVSRNLEGYSEGVAVRSDIVEAMVNAFKKPKIQSDLWSYNDEITRKLDRLLFR